MSLREVDEYIEQREEFARPILKKIRSLFHKACPDVEEVIKWGFPHFEYKGILGSMAGFKAHVGFGFWKGQLLKDPHGLFKGVGETSMNAMKVSSVDELPADKILLSYIKEAMAINAQGVSVPKAKKPARPKTVEVPDYILAALRKNKKALATFETFSPSHKREYLEWITEAKQEDTRAKRLATAIEWMSEGKPKNWKYMR